MMGRLFRPSPPSFPCTPVARLLIVEDNVAYADDVADFLAENGHQVSIGATAQAMWTALDGPPVDVILLDLGLPDACGMTLIPQLRERFPGTGILVLTARGMLDSRLQALRSGAHDYVTKPIKFDVLSRHIEQLCERMAKPLPGSSKEHGPW